MSEAGVKREYGRIVISDELRGKLMISIGCKVMVEDALMQLAGRSIQNRQRDKPKPAKPYWRKGERW